MTGAFPPAFSKGEQWDEGAFSNNSIGNFMIYQDRLETNLLKLFAHLENSEWFSIVSVII